MGKTQKNPSCDFGVLIVWPHYTVTIPYNYTRSFENGPTQALLLWECDTNIKTKAGFIFFPFLSLRFFSLSRHSELAWLWTGSPVEFKGKRKIGKRSEPASSSSYTPLKSLFTGFYEPSQSHRARVSVSLHESAQVFIDHLVKRSDTILLTLMRSNHRKRLSSGSWWSSLIAVSGPFDDIEGNIIHIILYKTRFYSCFAPKFSFTSTCNCPA